MAGSPAGSRAGLKWRRVRLRSSAGVTPVAREDELLRPDRPAPELHPVVLRAQLGQSALGLALRAPHVARFASASAGNRVRAPVQAHNHLGSPRGMICPLRRLNGFPPAYFS